MAKLVLVGGFPGGGTDLSRLVLDAHPDVEICGEVPLLYRLADHGYHPSSSFGSHAEIEDLRRLLRRLDVWDNLPSIDLEAETLLADGPIELEELLRHLSTVDRPKVWGNKTPQNTEHLSDLAALFPEARFVIVTRDIRDVAVSWQRKWGRHGPSCASRWNHRMLGAKRATERLGNERVLWVRFEDLLRDPRRWSEDVCRFLDIQMSERMLRHADHVEERVDGKRNYGRPIQADNTGRWAEALDRDAARRIEEVAWSAMQELGYEPRYATGQVELTTAERLAGLVGDAAALLLVGNRAKASNSAIDRLREIWALVRRRLIVR